MTMLTAVAVGLTSKPDVATYVPFPVGDVVYHEGTGTLQFSFPATHRHRLPDSLAGSPLVVAQPTPKALAAMTTNGGSCRVLVVGAGGIGCELLKTFVLRGVMNMDVIDLDTIDASNLNRQFLFTTKDVGQPKCVVAARVLSEGTAASITPHHGNVMDTERFSKDYFSQFNVVCCGLDNVAARKHVNRMCCRAGVPLVESGTTGFNGQVQPIQAGTTECYDCAPKPSGVPSFAVCTIHARPTTLVHCVHYAKELYNRMFGDVASSDVELEVLEGMRCDAERLFHTIHYDKIMSSAAVISGHPRGPPRPISMEDVREGAVDAEAAEFASAFLERYQSLLGRGERKAFDKDDDVAMGFVAATASLRAYIFNIDGASARELKTIAGNIIPAVATSNAVTGAIVVSQAMRYLVPHLSTGPMFVHLRNAPQARRRFVGEGTARRRIVDQYIMHSHALSAPNPSCLTCGTSIGRAFVCLDAEDTTLGLFVREVLQKDLGLAAPVVDIGTSTVYEHEELETLKHTKLSKWVSSSTSGRADFNVSDLSQEVNWVLTVQHEPTTDKTTSLYRLTVASTAAVMDAPAASDRQTVLAGDDDDDVTSYNPSNRHAKRDRCGDKDKAMAFRSDGSELERAGVDFVDLDN
eukprot:PhM_4_TR11496/c0_g2_i1/m.5964/K10685/UBLE1B, SAE2, UBA2; ubiquitin-like 1-activating enzyme E1 B